ncbi:MAG: hypothetical protein HS111_17435 [Kofleriaceae bacterium]|nr:hypothetical protein [Kofleriaceae bacterium]MCL4223051.1 hypothetical protein [Myxococcales bacterium]
MLRAVVLVVSVVPMLGCGGKPPPAPAAPAAADAATFATPEEAAAGAAPELAPEAEIDCRPFGDAEAPRLCLVQPATPEPGVLPYRLVLIDAAPAGAWRVLDRVEDTFQNRPQVLDDGEAEAEVSLGDAHEVGPGKVALAVELSGTYTMQYEGGGTADRYESTTLYWVRDGRLRELLKVETRRSSSGETDGYEEQSFDFEERATGGMYDVVVATHTVHNSWPTNETTDETTRARLTWNGDGYDHATIEDPDEPDEPEDPGDPGDPDDGD